MLKRIECTPETEHLKLSPDFWNNYNALKREAEVFYFRQTQLSNATKAYNFLSWLLEQNIPQLQDRHSFLMQLKEDIQDYGTLPEYTLKTIADWYNNGKPNYDSINNDLGKLSQNLGKDYLNKVKYGLKVYEPQVIVAIEDQIKGDVL